MTKVLDARGVEISEMNRIAVPKTNASQPVFGTVTAISDLDGDTDDEGRPFSINPVVTVKYDDDTFEDFHTFQDTSRIYESVYIIEDLVVIQ